MNVPYKTKSGLQIGIYYEKPKYIEYDADMLEIQKYFIYDKKSILKDYLEYKIYLAIVLFVLLIVYIKQ